MEWNCNKGWIYSTIETIQNIFLRVLAVVHILQLIGSGNGGEQHSLVNKINVHVWHNSTSLSKGLRICITCILEKTLHFGQTISSKFPTWIYTKRLPKAQFVVMSLLLLVNYAKAVESCSNGYYSGENAWYPCEESWRTWSQANTCDSCDIYRSLDSSTSLCISCPEGEYMDTTSNTCRDCGDNWGGLWSYQEKCFACSENEFLDLESFECLSEDQCVSATYSSSQYRVPIWRTLNFYINPESDEMLELGTILYPYRSFRSIASEILTQHSSTDSNINIYLKENTRVYIEDGTFYIVSVGSVSISSYSETSSTPGNVLIVPTAISQPAPDSRSKFHILNNFDILIDGKITAERETTIVLSQSSMNLSNVDFYREVIDYNKYKTLIKAIGLQNRDVRIRKFHEWILIMFVI